MPPPARAPGARGAGPGRRAGPRWMSSRWTRRQCNARGPKRDRGAGGVSGTFREVTAPSRVAFAWKWEKPGAREMLVTLTIQPNGGGSRPVLVHERFPGAEERDQHSRGREGGLLRLPQAIWRPPEPHAVHPPIDTLKERTCPSRR